MIKQYEITLKWVGKGKQPDYLENEYGFGTNPPIVLSGKNEKSVRNKLKLPKDIKIHEIELVGSW